MVTFSSRVPEDLAPNRLWETLTRIRASGRTFIDLTISNPTRAGIAYPADLLAPLGDPRGLVYAPEAFGMPAAREAVAGDFARRGLAVRPDRVALTASTSEAYSFLFKVLCDPGDEVLVPRPSYPLFEHLTRLEAIAAVPYDLEYLGGWTIDVDALARARTPRTRALLLVNPNNPTGSITSERELDRLARFSGDNGIALISDEVFADYTLRDDAPNASGLLIARTDVLGFTLGGLSKSIGLPQAKLGWIAASGAEAVVHAALARLELVCDTYLSASTPVQAAAAELLDRGVVVRRRIQERVRANHAALQAQVSAYPACRLLRADAGWYAVLQVPSLMPEEELVLRLLEDDDVLVHPGYFFDFPTESFLVVSLLAPPEAFTEGVSRILRHFDCSLAAV